MPRRHASPRRVASQKNTLFNLYRLIYTVTKRPLTLRSSSTMSLISTPEDPFAEPAPGKDADGEDDPSLQNYKRDG